MMRRRAFILVGLCAGLVIGCVATTALANGTTTDASIWPAMNALLNVGNIIMTALFGVAAWFVRGIKSQIKRIADTLDDVVDWQVRWAKAAEANVVMQANKQNEHERACVREHGAPAGRPEVPEVPLFQWPPPPRRRSTESKEF